MIWTNISNKVQSVNALFIQIFVNGDSLFFFFFIPKASQQIMNFNNIIFFSKLIELFNCPP